MVSPLEWAEQDGLSRFTYTIQEKVHVLSPADAAAYLLQSVYAPFSALDQEELWVLLLNHKNRITHTSLIYRGNISSAIVRPGELFKEAVRFNAPSVILSHCHPSGDAQPSPQDLEVTKLTIAASQLLHIQVLDHIIIGNNCWMSLREQGEMLFKP